MCETKDAKAKIEIVRGNTQRKQLIRTSQQSKLTSTREAIR